MLHWGRRWAEEALCVLILLAGAFLAFYPGLLGGAVPMALQGPLFMAPWEEARPAGLSPLESSFHAQHSQRFYPWYQHLSQAGQGEASVLWMEEEGFGVPFYALWRSRVLSPFSLPFYLASMPLAISLSFLLKMFVAGLCAYYATRRFGFAPAIALFAGVSWQWAGPIFLWSATPLSDVAVWLPLVLLFWEKVAANMKGALPFGAVVLLLTLLGGEPEAMLTIVLLGVVYLAIRIWQSKGQLAPRPVFQIYGLAVLTALLLGAVQIVPWLEYLLQSARATSGPALLPSPQDLFAILSPHWLPQSRADSSHIASLLHGGLAPLLLVPVYWVVRPFFDHNSRARLEAILGLALASALVSYVGSGVWGFLPGQFGAEHGLILLPLALIFLTAAALEEWVELSMDEAKEAFARLRVIALPIWLAVLIIALLSAVLAESASFGGFALILLLIVATAGIVFGTLIKPRVRINGYGGALISATALVWAWSSLLPQTPRADVFPETGFVSRLQSMDARVGGSRGIQYWPLAGNNVSQVFSPSGVRLKRFTKFAEALERDPLLLRRSGAEALLLTREDIQGVFGPVRPVLNIHEVFPSGAILFRDLEAQPRARMIFEGRRTEAPNSSELRSDSVSLVEGASMPEVGGTKPQVRITHGPQTPLTRSLTVKGAKPGLLVSTESWYPGWKAAVDGRVSEIYPVDIVFRGVELGEGDHEVLFWYSPASLKFGGFLSFLGALLFLSSLGTVRRFLPRRFQG